MHLTLDHTVKKKTSRLKGSGLDLDLKQRNSSLIPGEDFVES